MKIIIQNFILFFFLLSISSGARGQKTNVTHAGIGLSNLRPMYGNFYQYGTFPKETKQHLLQAKNHIDRAAAHVETKDNIKMFAFKGEIYFYLALYMMQDESISEMSFYDCLNISLQSYTNGLQVVNGKKTWRLHIQEYSSYLAVKLYSFALALRENGDYASADEVFKYSKSFELLSNR